MTRKKNESSTHKNAELGNTQTNCSKKKKPEGKKYTRKEKLVLAKKFLDKDFKLFLANGIKDDGSCTCPKGKECPSPGKHPFAELYPKGLNSATNNLKRIQQELKQYPHLNIALVPPENIFVLDFDKKHGGIKTYNYLLNNIKGFRNENTITVKTGGGGAHVYFSGDPDVIKHRALVRKF